MEIIRYHTRETRIPQVGVRDQGLVFGLPDVPSLAALLALPLEEIKRRVHERERSRPITAADVTLLPPVDGRSEERRVGKECLE